jgi:hypothetical protein
MLNVRYLNLRRTLAQGDESAIAGDNSMPYRGGQTYLSGLSASRREEGSGIGLQTPSGMKRYGRGCKPRPA